MSSSRELRIPLPPELAEEGLAVVTLEDGRDVVLLETGGEYRAIDRLCPHEDGDLGEGLMFGNNLKCPLHGYIFDLTNGRCLNQRGYLAQVYAVGVEGDTLVLVPRE